MKEGVQVKNHALSGRSTRSFWNEGLFEPVRQGMEKGDLLLINGELDENVDPVSTLQVVGALVKAHKRFEQLYLPGFGHNLGDNYIGGRILDFFRRTLK